MKHNDFSDTSLGRGIRIIDSLSEKRVMRFAEIRSLLGDLSSSTTTRILKNLQEMGVINKNRQHDYSLAIKVKYWSRNIPELKTITLPFMESLSEEFKVTVSLVERSGNEIICTEKILDENSPSLRKVGGIRYLPTPHGIGAGFFLSKEELADDNLWEQFKADEPDHDYDCLRKMLTNSVDQGFWHDPAIINPLCERFAAPIKVNDSVIAILGVGVATVACQDKEYVRRLIDKMISYANELSTDY